MGPRTRSAASGLQLGRPVGSVDAVSAAAPSKPTKSKADPLGQAPATLRKSRRIRLTRKEEPKTTPSQQSSKANPATTQEPATKTEPQTAHFNRIPIDQLLASPQQTIFAQPTRTRQQLQLEIQPKAEPDCEDFGFQGVPTFQEHTPSPCYPSDDDSGHDDLRDGHYDEETSEEELISKLTRRQYESGERQRQRSKPSRHKSRQIKTVQGWVPITHPTIFPHDLYQSQSPVAPLSPSSLPPADTMIVERKIKLVTEQHNINKAPQVEGFPMKEWTVEVYILDEAGKEKPARCFHKVVYNLHPSFDNPVQTFHEPPFKCTNEGWGEFEMTIDCYTTEKGGKQSILHDLNFANPTYENIHTIQFKNPSQALQAVLRETGPLPTDEDRKARKNLDGPGGSIVSKKKKTYDLEKMADAIPRLSEDDLLHVIQLIHDNKNDDTYIMNNPDAGEFSIDLYTMPDNLCRLMWEFLVQSPEGHRLR